MLSDEVGIEYFTWDAAGNLFDTAHVAASVVACPDHRMREYKGYQYEYDAWGNVICKRSAAAEQSFTWDAEGRLMEVRSRQARVRFRYDALGRRTSKSIERHDADHARQANSSTEVVHFVWEGERLMQERSEKEIRTFLYQPAADGFMSYAPLA
ncbi:RHS repeat domain-containing protein, partial [Pseudomonas sp. 71_D]